MRRFLLVVLVAAACNKSSSTSTASGSASGSASGAASCSDDDIAKHIKGGLAATTAYFAEIEKHAATWGDDCEAVRKDLLTLEPAANAFAAEVTSVREWGEGLSADCKKRVGAYGEHLPEAKELETRAQPLEARVMGVLGHCKDAPGFREAAARGLKLMRKKQDAP